MGLRFDNIPLSAYDGIIRKLFGHLNLQDKMNHYECVCPFCGDMKQAHKRKLWIYKDTWKTTCFKGCFDGSLLKLLQENYLDEYHELITYAITDDDNRTGGNKPAEKPLVQRVVPTLPFMPGEIVSLSDPSDPLAREARDICAGRRIRKDVYETWFACRTGEQFYHRNPDGSIQYYPGTTRPIGNEYRHRIIMPYYKFGGLWGQFDARDMDPKSEQRYLNFKGVRREAYNIDFVDFTKRFYILEGLLDSTFIRNSIAIGGISHLAETMADNPKIRKYINNAVVIWDNPYNDVAGRRASVSAISKQFRWFDWEGIASKDINAAVLAGEMPLDSSGYVEPAFLERRIREKDMADIVMTMRFGNIQKDMFKEKMEARRNAMKNNAHVQNSKHSISFI